MPQLNPDRFIGTHSKRFKDSVLKAHLSNQLEISSLEHGLKRDSSKNSRNNKSMNDLNKLKKLEDEKVVQRPKKILQKNDSAKNLQPMPAPVK